MNAIVYYCDDERRIFPSELSFSTSKNIAMDIFEKVKEHSKTLPNGLRHKITFYDCSIHKQMVLPHMYPLEPNITSVPISLKDENQIKKEISEFII